MSLYTVIYAYINCEHCGGDGYICEHVTCPICLGDSVEDREPCERCWDTDDGRYGKIEVSEVLCRFCENSTNTICQQYEADSLEECLILIKAYLRAWFKYDPTEDESIGMDEPLKLSHVENNWVVSLSDDNGDYECFIIKTA